MYQPSSDAYLVIRFSIVCPTNITLRWPEFMFDFGSNLLMSGLRVQVANVGNCRAVLLGSQSKNHDVIQLELPESWFLYLVSQIFWARYDIYRYIAIACHSYDLTYLHLRCTPPKPSEGAPKPSDPWKLRLLVGGGPSGHALADVVKLERLRRLKAGAGAVSTVMDGFEKTDIELDID